MRPRIANLGPLAALPFALGACGGTAPVPARPNVLFVSVDTLRADHLGAYGYGRPTSPRIDALADGGLVFENAQASASWTLPGLASVMTSYYTSTHGCWSFGSRLDDSFTTLTEILTAAGFDTACVTSHLFVTTRHGLQQGFVHFDDTFAYPAVDPEDNVTSGLISDRGVRFLEQKAAAPDGKPWFLWLHYFDPHANYMAHEGITERFRTPGERAPNQVDIDNYDGEIAFTDRHIGRVLDALDETGQAGNTIVVLFSDHGEEFLDHGGLRHGHTLFGELVRVPLILRAPGLEPGRVAGIVRTVDIFPTVLDLVGLPTPADIMGRGLLREGASLPALAETRLDQGALMEALVHDGHKLIHDLRDDSYALFDLVNDPREQEDIAGQQPARLAELRKLLRGSVRQSERLSERFETSPELDLSPAVLEQLKGLGYGGGD